MNISTKKITVFFCALSMAIVGSAQFSTTITNWNVPPVEDLPTGADQISALNYGVIDLNGDGLVDLIDAENNATQNVWANGNQQYWRVFMNTGTTFNPTAAFWNIPPIEDLPIGADQISGTNYGLADMNGDGLPDLVDTEDNVTQNVWVNGNQQYWRVFINTGTGFNPTAAFWNIPPVEDLPTGADQLAGTNYGLVDMNGDGKLDLVDAENNATQNVWANGNQQYWRVFINSGTGFNPTAVFWNIPPVEDLPIGADQISGTNYGLADMNGDGIIDLIDTEDNTTQNVWVNGNQQYWRVFINSGSAFSTTTAFWNIPAIEDLPTGADQLYGTNYGLADINADGKLDLIDAEDNATQNVWLNGNQQYWRVFANTGSGFNPTTIFWNIPGVEDLPIGADQLSGLNYGLVDMDGNGAIDMVDAESNSTQNVWLNGNQQFWRVYYNQTPVVGTAEAITATVRVFPNPAHDQFALVASDELLGLPYEVIDAYGRLVHSGSMDTATTVVDCSTFANGIYFVRVAAAQGQSFKFIKQ